MKSKTITYSLAIIIFLAVAIIISSSTKSVMAQGNETNQSNATNESLPYIDPEIYRAFENQTWVRVIVKYKIAGIKDFADITDFNNPEEAQFFYKNLTSSLFDYIPITEMKGISTGFSTSFSAEVTKNGFAKLINNSNITQIYLDIMTYNLKNESSANITQIEETNENGIKSNKFLLSLITTTLVLVIITYIIINRRRG